ncbi:GGDEF domain-containing protein [Gorillibacterium sp. CAU 1737]|uniref:GGDEF domain-containing protein n=1 Tax=Gorillibacterium sp. CAU 1737 TaxID=3140362 RepID=UPI003261A99A
MPLNEVREFSFALLSIVIAILTAGILLALRTSRKAKAFPLPLRILSAFLIGLSGLMLMHVLNKPEGIPLFRLSEWLPAFLAYCLVIFLFLLAGFRLNDYREERKSLRQLAYVDNITGLYNKNGLDDLRNKLKGRERIAVLFLDLNRFKSVNDTLGHHIGDLLLQAIGIRLGEFAGRRRMIYRIGGDEFVMVARGYTQRETEELAVRILERITDAYVLDKHTLSISGSIGISINRSHEKVEWDRLLKEADSAMYTAKQLGSGRYSVFRRMNG